MNSEINNENIRKSANGNLNLINLLEELNVETVDVQSKFSIIAEELMCNYQIVSVSGEKFNIHEIEFYFFNKNHLDTSVHLHNLKAGQWRVHYSGLDITFNGCTYLDSCKNKKCNDCKLSSYGGILIRSIGNSINLIVGPLRVQTTLLSGGSISGSKGLLIEENRGCNSIKVPKPSKRCGVKSANNFEKEDYCYYNNNLLIDNPKSDGTKTRIVKKI
ncbi:MAG: hypothetical protein WCL70_12970 [Paludibacter sp.]